MPSVWIDEAKEVQLKELLKPVVDYHSSVFLEFFSTPDRFDRVAITRNYETMVQDGNEEITIHKKMVTVIPCRFTSYTNEKPTSAWLNDAKTFLYALRMLRPGQYLKMDFWPSNDCEMFKKKGIAQETIIFSILSEKDNHEIFSFKYNQVHGTEYSGPFMFRYLESRAIPDLSIPAKSCTAES